jgi:hypothetical protein
MRVETGWAGMMRYGLGGLSIVLCTVGFACDAAGQQTALAKKNVSGARPGLVKKPAPTYSKDVAAILQNKCQNCHRRHQVGPR